MIRRMALLTAMAMTALCCAAEPFVIRIVDHSTGRGVPLVELKTVDHRCWYTDNTGLIAIDDHSLLGEEVFFFVSGHGYEFPKDGFGYPGTRVRVEPGGSTEVTIQRRNIAERLYRITGAGLYEHAMAAGEKPPIAKPKVNAKVVGCDSTQTAVYREKLFWIWGDTSRLSYPLGNFNASGAVSTLPANGGLDPALGVNFEYFVGNDGFARQMAPIPGEGPTWLTALVCVKDAMGKEHLVAAYNKIKPPLTVYERGLCEFDPEIQQFKKLLSFERQATLVPSGHAFRDNDRNSPRLYFGEAVPHMRTADRYESLIDPQQYEAVNAVVEFTDASTSKPVKHHHGAVEWSPYRKRWVSIFTQEGGKSSYLGEVYYAEAKTPEGPWRKATKILTHDRYSFYNPKQHPYFSKDDGRYLYFEGTYSATFSGNTDPTPLYDYNQIMYRLDLSDGRLGVSPNSR